MNNGNNEFSVSSDSVVNNIPIIENYDVTPKKKNGGKKVLFILLAILLLAGAVVGGFFLGKEYANKEDNVSEEKVDKEENKESTEDTKDETKEEVKEPVLEIKKNDEYTFVKEYKTKTTFDGKDKNITTLYYLDLIKFDSSLGTFHGQIEEDYYEVRADIYLDNKLVIDSVVVSFDSDKSVVNKFIDIEPKYETKIFKDTNKVDEYLMLYLDYTTIADDDGLFGYWTVMNSDGKVLESFGVKNTNEWSNYKVNEDKIKNRDYMKISDYNKKYNYNWEIVGDKEYILYYDDSLIEIHDDHLYYLTSDDVNGDQNDDDPCSGGYEYKFVITNGVTKSILNAELDNESFGLAGQC